MRIQSGFSTPSLYATLFSLPDRTRPLEKRLFSTSSYHAKAEGKSISLWVENSLGGLSGKYNSSGLGFGTKLQLLKDKKIVIREN